MILFPAIDLKDGACVRLERGDMDKATIFSTNPAEQAKSFENQGFEYLHLVDLNGAFVGESINSASVGQILKTISMPVQLGGGIRDLNAIEAWLDKGISRVILGTVAVKDPDLVIKACRIFEGQVAVSIDARDGYVAVEGWAEISNIKATELAKKFEDVGVSAIIYTDISRDGLLKGINLDATFKMAKAVHMPVIASGGLASMDDIKALCTPEAAILEGVISGRALYDGCIDIAQALKLLKAA